MMRNSGFTSFDVWSAACFDPATLAVGSMVATGAGGLLSAGGTIAGGNAAAQAGEMQKQAAYAAAQQDEMNATQAIASSQRTMLESQNRARLVASSAKAAGAAGGFDAGFGSNVTNQGEIAERGSYQSLTDLFNGESTATGLRNKAAAERYSGDAAEIEGKEKQDASYLSAAGTIAGSAGSMMKTYGGWQYPQSFKV